MSDPLMTRDMVESLLESTTETTMAGRAVGIVIRSHLAALDRIAELEAKADNWRVLVEHANRLHPRDMDDSDWLDVFGQLVSRAADPGTTHAEGCHAWGPKHYECATRRIAELEAANARLARMLAVERGDESGAPEGWRRGKFVSSWTRQRKRGGRWSVRYVRLGTAWRELALYLDGIEVSVHATALEAMEAADAVEKGQS